MKYLLDTNVVSDLIRKPQGVIATRIAQVSESMVCTSIIVSAELRFGAAKKGSPRLTGQVEAVLRGLEILAFEAPSDVRYGLLRARLEQAGSPVGGNDLLIAAQVMTLGYTLVTDNESEFARIPGLRWENWLREAAP